jgi:hypothetical protein
MHADRKPYSRPHRNHSRGPTRFRLISGVEHTQRRIHPSGASTSNNRFKVIVEYLVGKVTM